jgi:hypothetical protein
MRVYFLTITKNEVNFSATLRNIGNPWLKHIHVTDVSMCSGETNFIFFFNFPFLRTNQKLPSLAERRHTTRNRSDTLSLGQRLPTLRVSVVPSNVRVKQSKVTEHADSKSAETSGATRPTQSHPTTDESSDSLKHHSTT